MTTETNSNDVKIAWIQLARGFAWPIAFLLAFLSVSGSVASLVGRTGSLFDRANTVQFGDLTIEMGREIASRASPEVKDILSELSPSQLSVLFTIPLAPENKYWSADVFDAWYTPSFTCSGFENFDDITSLSEINLIVIEPISMENSSIGKFLGSMDKESICVFYKLTDRGRRVKEFLVDVVDTAFVELSTGSKDE